MKRFIYLLLIVFLLTSCSGKNSNEPDYKKEVLANIKENDEKEVLEKIKNHEDIGVYKYISYNTDDNNIVQELIKGKNEDLEFSIINNNDYIFSDGKTVTFANKEKNLYYQEEINKNNQEKFDDTSFYQELYDSGLSKVDIEDDYITLSYENVSYSKYDAKTLDLIEDKFVGNGKNILKKLESKDKDVKSAYDNYIKIIEGMGKAKSVGEVTGNE